MPSKNTNRFDSKKKYVDKANFNDLFGFNVVYMKLILLYSFFLFYFFFVIALNSSSRLRLVSVFPARGAITAFP